MPSNNKAQRKRKQAQKKKMIKIQDYYITDAEFDIIKDNISGIEKLYPDLIFTYEYDYKDMFGDEGKIPILRIDEYEMAITLTLETTIDDIIKRIDKYHDVKRNGTSCLLCKTSLTVDTPRVSHKGCNGHWCGTCYIHQFRKGYGIISCPNCSYKIGNKHPNDASMFMSEMQIRRSLNMSLSDPLH